MDPPLFDLAEPDRLRLRRHQHHTDTTGPVGARARGLVALVAGDDVPVPRSALLSIRPHALPVGTTASSGDPDAETPESIRGELLFGPLGSPSSRLISGCCPPLKAVPA